MKRHAATPILRLAARLLRVAAVQLRKRYSVGGSGKLWPYAEKWRHQHELMVSTANQLDDISAGLNNVVVAIDNSPRVERAA